MTDSVSRRHIRAVDIPGWPSPPKVRDISTVKYSWGSAPRFEAVVQDELGFLWADGSAVPQAILNLKDPHPFPVLFWTEDGLGLWFSEKSLGYLGSISRLDMELDRWIPIVMASKELPDFIKVLVHSADLT